jgi:hypothetical protein
MLLQSFDRARDFATLDPTTGTMELFSQDGEAREQLEASIKGLFSVVNDSFVAIYRRDGMLVLKIGDKDYMIDDTMKTRVDKSHSLAGLLRHDRRRNTFHLVRNGEPVVSFAYRAPVTPNRSFDFTFTGDEDFDFMLFIHHVLSDSERRNRVWI